MGKIPRYRNDCPVEGCDHVIPPSAMMCGDCEDRMYEESDIEVVHISGTLHDGRPFNIDIDPRNMGIIEFTVKVQSGHGDRGPNNEWVDIYDLPYGDYTVTKE